MIMMVSWYFKDLSHPAHWWWYYHKFMMIFLKKSHLAHWWWYYEDSHLVHSAANSECWSTLPRSRKPIWSKHVKVTSDKKYYAILSLQSGACSSPKPNPPCLWCILFLMLHKIKITCTWALDSKSYALAGGKKEGESDCDVVAVKIWGLNSVFVFK